MRIITLLIAILSSNILLAQSTLVRGPYLNILTHEGVIVRWKSTEDEKGIVRYGTHPDSLNLVVEESSNKNEHEIQISGLQPYTKYYYQIGNSTTAYTEASQDFRFTTAPLPDTKQNVKIWALGDFGDGSIHAKRVRDAYINHYEKEDTDLWIWLGDNAYAEGKEEEYQKHVFEVFPKELARMGLWMTPGNHDYKSIDWLTHKGPYYDLFTLPTKGETGGRPTGDESYYSFDYANIHFISINSEYVPHILSNNTIFTNWLEKDLQETDKDWIIAFWHQPPYSKGTHDSDDFFGQMEMTRKHVNPILEKYGCDLVLGGHSHVYERSYMIKDHFGFSNTFAPRMIVDGSNGNPNDGNTYQKYTEGPDANEGTVYVVAGSGGKKGENEELGHPAMFISSDKHHGSLFIEVDGLTLNAKFIDTTGGIFDEFSIQKNQVVTSNQLHFDRLVKLNAYPNPFKESFTIEFNLEQSEDVEISVKDILGRSIESIARKTYPAGKHQIVIQAKAKYTTGSYLIELKTADKLGAKRVLYVE